jgi:HEPN domain-containing protein
MTKEAKIQYWLKLSETDLQVAEDLLRLKHNLYVGFMCHQCIEKIMKGYYTKVTKEKDDAASHARFALSGKQRRVL